MKELNEGMYSDSANFGGARVKGRSAIRDDDKRSSTTSNMSRS